MIDEESLGRVQIRVMRSKPFLFCLDCKATIKKGRDEAAGEDGKSRLSDFVTRAGKHLIEVHGGDDR